MEKAPRVVIATWILLFLSGTFPASPGERPGNQDGCASQKGGQPFYDKDLRWKEDRQRDKLELPESIIDILGVKPGIRIGEAGAGDGYFTFFLSRRVGDQGVIYANDNDKSMLAALEYYAGEFFGGLKNIVPVLGADDDPLFPSHELDMIVIYGSFHDFTRREDWLQNARKYLKADGALAIIDGYWPHHGALTKELVIDLGRRAGFRSILYKDCSRDIIGEDGTKDTRSQHVHVFVK